MALTVTSKTTRAQVVGELNVVQAELESLRAKHENFRKDVFYAATEAKDTEGWCSEGFREVMENLGLDEFIESTERVVILKVLVDAEDTGYDVENMDDISWARAGISKLRYASPSDLESYSVEELPQDN